MKKLLITGHRGLLGSSCVRRLGINHEICVFHGDLMDARDFQVTLAEKRPDAIVHCAAKVGGVKSNRDNPVSFLGDNLHINTNVIESAHKYGIQNLIFVGTSCIYPRDAKVPVKESSLLTGPFEPSVEAYAIAKLAGYRLCKAYREQHGRRYLTVNPSNLYGPNDSYGPSAHVIPALIKRIDDCVKTGEPFIVWGDGSAVREFLYVDDAADAIGVVLEHSEDDITNIGSGIGTSIYELVNALLKIEQLDINAIWDISQPTGIPKKTFDVSKLRSLGWKPKFNLLDGLELTLKDFHKNYANLRLK